MRLISFIFLSLILSNTGLAQSYSDQVLVNGCSLIDWSGKKLRNFPGSFCQFMDDGSFLSGSLGALRYIDKDSTVKWTYQGHIHHQVNFSEDREKILVLSSEYHEKNKHEYRIDRFLILSKDGNILVKQSAADWMKQVNREGYRESEMTHFNSFYEIPEITAPAPDYIKKGNFILNSNRIGVFIVSADLKKVLHFRRLPTSDDHQIHDVQILPNGHMLYFNNTHSFQDNDEISYSTIEELDLNTGKLVFEFKANPKASFFSRHCGGVQKLDDDKVLFSHMLTGTYVYSLKKKDVIKYIFKTHVGEGDRFFPSQQVKAMDLRKFLLHWK